jgi:hypothetical protein
MAHLSPVPLACIYAGIPYYLLTAALLKVVSYGLPH